MEVLMVEQRDTKLRNEAGTLVIWGSAGGKPGQEPWGEAWGTLRWCEWSQELRENSGRRTWCDP